MDPTITLKVNGKEYAVPAAPGITLQFALRDDMGLTGTKFGCGMAQCGCCTVLLDGHLCRCGTYNRILQAVQLAAQRMRSA